MINQSRDHCNALVMTSVNVVILILVKLYSNIPPTVDCNIIKLEIISKVLQNYSLSQKIQTHCSYACVPETLKFLAN